MNSKLENYYLSKPEPYQGCLLALRDIILKAHPGIEQERKFQIPFFSYKGMKLGYIWLDHKKLMIGFCTDKRLLKFPENTKPKDQYESFRIDPAEDIPHEIIQTKIRQYIKAINANGAGMAGL
ncbi:DUF1801 domain-containing protein [Terrimonas sp. NA20]|uniref:DUF1801 domain-containing protein n=1 Tax=Terrimonas ginsenosidimutans TaxID=2908004 RepID=A0ABS9KXN1_9BACT|nr:DUF1801 domain-containing protein [Terrimonas ginsenosidimutans]MCG2617078.1 DUF1801 domain-containing protein [Terrimonas ginsenosidimutans]